MHEFVKINDEAYLSVNHFAVSTPYLHGILTFYAQLGGLAIFALLLLAAWWKSRSSSDPVFSVAIVFWAAAGTVIAWALAHYGLKPLFGEKRPYWVLHHVEVLVPLTHGYAFPSGHATIAGAVLTGLWFTKNKIIALINTPFAFLLSADRVYVGAHYPGDVIGGLIFGFLVILILYPIAVKLLYQFNQMLVRKEVLKPLITTSNSKETQNNLA